MRYLHRMDTRSFNAFRIAYFFLVVLLVCGADSKSLCPGYSNYGQTGGIGNVTPDKDSIKIGDTILFSCSLASKLKFVNRADSSHYDISGISNLLTNFTISSLLGPNLLAGAVDSFDYMSPTIGSLTSVTDFSAPFVKIIHLQDQHGTYLFSVDIIARRRGVYAMRIVFKVY
jgi:hypothetical protein